jgi:hypothetical protein
MRLRSDRDGREVLRLPLLLDSCLRCLDGDLKKAKWLSIANHIANTYNGDSETFSAWEHPPVDEAKGELYTVNIISI